MYALLLLLPFHNILRIILRGSQTSQSLTNNNKHIWYQMFIIWKQKFVVILKIQNWHFMFIYQFIWPNFIKFDFKKIICNIFWGGGSRDGHVYRPDLSRRCGRDWMVHDLCSYCSCTKSNISTGEHTPLIDGALYPSRGRSVPCQTQRFFRVSNSLG
jgi:hypothetical protein